VVSADGMKARCTGSGKVIRGVMKLKGICYERTTGDSIVWKRERGVGV